MKKTLLLVFIHGFKGSDHTFNNFPQDLRALLSNALPKIEILSVQYPQFETRGDLNQCVAKFKEWLQDKVIDLEVANGTPSPTVDPSVHVVLCGHSMGGIVAAETLLSVAKDEPLPSQSWANDTTNTTTADGARPVTLPLEDPIERASSAPPVESSRLFFPYIRAVLAFDTPYLGISPGVLAHGAEEHINQASAAYKAFDTASQFFGWGSPGGSSARPIPNASAKALPAADGSTTAWGTWGKYAMYGGAIAAVAGAAGAAYLNYNQIQEGLLWAGSHLEFVGCLARGAELQKRVESVVALTKTHGIGFANFYGALDEKISSKTQYAGAVLGQDRTFCVVPKAARKQDPAAGNTSRSKGAWVKCVNSVASDELKAHTSMFAPQWNRDYHAMLPRARDQIAAWVDNEWYESSMPAEGQAAGLGATEV
ncbi:hypothetical protein BAUCODRAFT_86437 [Baudoinia panamericana UAMH 10762]|uniref:AB hydrolase-1 domain-containing protein n=1 Tax=Baudoinia panamericana (strain UAMH 10762) TaxID=717646 RepID=M2MN42_BAUPA|nr:uncharacterized protein BAUCODRAFT_86437 [Baudoinia panamericana UAMH 10762]EMC98096.1 hypothetical protein BAUCODRAFT_86437 [Baudoinia panamericana UAMH 10762]